MHTLETRGQAREEHAGTGAAWFGPLARAGRRLTWEGERTGGRVSPWFPRRGRTVAVMVALSIFAGLTGPALSAETAISDQEPARLPNPVDKGSIGVGNSLFWDGELFVKETTGSNLPYGFSDASGGSGVPEGLPEETCGKPDNPDPCWAYSFQVTGTPQQLKEARLRVGIDMNRRGHCLQLEAWAPDREGNPTYGDATKNHDYVMIQCPELLPLFPQQWNMEGPNPNVPQFIQNPAPGVWTLRVVPFLVEDWGFRLRVKLEKEAQPTMNLEPPDLEAYPPYEFGFVAPANPNAGTAVDKQNPPGPPGISCTEDEQAEALEEGRQPPTRCLRFSAAMYNVGKGPLDLLLLGESTLGGDAVQRIHRGDGEVGEERPAGQWTFHESHRHPHYAGFAGFELYRILDTSGPKMDPVGTNRLDASVSGNKSGWNPADQRFADWHRFDQAPANEILLQCVAQEEKCIPQGSGWGDHYRWQRPGNYVAFPTNLDGTNVNGDYVLRMVVDKDNRVVENNDRDNSAYAWIRVKGEEVTICERGRGLSPWDPNKRMLTPSFWLSTYPGDPTQGGTTADSPLGDCRT